MIGKNLNIVQFDIGSYYISLGNEITGVGHVAGMEKKLHFGQEKLRGKTT
jgi:hypothetical protein